MRESKTWFLANTFLLRIKGYLNPESHFYFCIPSQLLAYSTDDKNTHHSDEPSLEYRFTQFKLANERQNLLYL